MNYSKVQLISTLLPVFEVKDKKKPEEAEETNMYKASKQFNTSRECRKHKNTHSIWMADFFNLKDFLHHPENF